MICVASQGLGVAEKAVTDYSEAFTKFRELGLRDISNAEWGHAPWVERRGMSEWNHSFHFQGNSWRVSEKGGFRYIGLPGNSVGFEKEISGREDDGSQRLKWKPVDLRVDIENAIKLAKLDSKARENKYNYKRFEPLGILFASEIAQKGFSAEGNTIVHAIFQGAEEPENVIYRTINKIANTQYREIFYNYYLEGKVEQFIQSAKELCNRFPLGWHFHTSVLRLANGLEKQHSAESNTKMDGDLSAVNKALAFALLQAKKEELNRDESENSSGPKLGPFTERGNVWVLAESEAIAEEEARQLDYIRGIEWIERRGRESFPLLIALLRDENFMPLPRIKRDSLGMPQRFDNNMDYLYSREFDPSGKSVGSREDEEEVYRKLLRPRTRGEFAAQLLGNVLLFGDDDYGSNSVEGMSAEHLEDLAQSFYKRIKDLSSQELVEIYLSEGVREQRISVYFQLAKSEDQEDHTLFEEYLFKEEDLSNFYEPVEVFAKNQGEGAIPLVKKYLSMLPEDRSGWIGERLKGYLNTETLDDILAKVVSGKVKLGDVRSSIEVKLAEEKVEGGISKILKSIVEAADGNVQYDLLGLFGTIRRHGEDSFKYEYMEDKNLWEMLLSDDKIMESDPRFTVSSGAAWHFFELSDGNFIKKFYPAFEFIEEEVIYKHLLNLAKARLAGKELTEELIGIDPKTLSDADVEQLAERLRAMSLVEREDFLAAMSFAEQYAYRKHSNEELKKLIQESNVLVRKVLCQSCSDEEKADFESYLNKAVSRELVDELLEKVKTYVEREEIVYVLLNIQAESLPYSLRVVKGKKWLGTRLQDRLAGKGNGVIAMINNSKDRTMVFFPGSMQQKGAQLAEQSAESDVLEEDQIRSHGNYEIPSGPEAEKKFWDELENPTEETAYTVRPFTVGFEVYIHPN